MPQNNGDSQAVEHAAQPQSKDAPGEFRSPNKKSAAMQEVEDDAIYITERRIQEDRDERAREAAKQEREQFKEDKKGK